MKEYFLFSIFLYLTKHKRTTSADVASNFGISPRSVYRYIDALSLLGVPVVTKLGKGGGIELLNEFYIDGIMLSKNEKKFLKDFVQGNESQIESVKKIIAKLI